jgi:hypothetical protein
MTRSHKTEPRLKWPRFWLEVAGAGLARPLGPHTEGGLPASRLSLVLTKDGNAPGYGACGRADSSYGMA